MTLKQSVEDTRGPLRAFFNARLPNTKIVHADWKRRAATSISIAAPADKILTTGGVTRRYPYDEVGHVASLRLTLLFSTHMNEAALPPSRHSYTRQPSPAAEAFHAAFTTALGQARDSSETAMSVPDGRTHVAGRVRHTATALP